LSREDAENRVLEESGKWVYFQSIIYIYFQTLWNNFYIYIYYIYYYIYNY
jgi:hypothetical protein